MAKHDDDPGSALAEALAAPLAAGSLEVALHAARAFHMRHPGDEDAKRVLEALELLQAQVWFSGADEEGGDPRFGIAAQHLEALDLPGALARYEEIIDHEGEGSRAVALAMNVRVVMAAASAQQLPTRHAPAPAPAEGVANNPVFQETTRIAGAGELPLNAFSSDEPTANVTGAVAKAAYPDEPTRTLNLGDYQLFEEVADDGSAGFGGDQDEESTGVLDPQKTASLVEKTKQPPPLKRPVDVKGRAIPPAPKIETKEVTRIAGANELPLEQVRRLMEGEKRDQELDAFMGEITTKPMEPESSIAIDVSEFRFARGEPKPVVEKSIAIDVSDLSFLEEEAATAALPDVDAEEPVKPDERLKLLQSFEPSLAIDITVLPDFEAEAETPPGGTPIEEDHPIPPTAPMQAVRPPLEVTQPMPAVVAPRFEEDALAVTAPIHAAMDTVPLPAVQPPRGPLVPKPPGIAVPPPPVAPPPARGSAPPPPMVAPIAPPVLREEEQLYTPPPIEPEPEIVHTPPPDFDERVTAPPALHDAIDEVTSAMPAARGPAVPPPPAIVAPAPEPAAPLPPLSADPVHAPLDTSEVSLPSDVWKVDAEEPPDAGDGQRVEVGMPEISWTGVRLGGHAAVFEPGAESVEDDTWGDPQPTKSPQERAADALVAKGELGEALRVYQDLAAQHPDQPHLWDRVAQIARLLQQRSGG